MGIPLGLVRSVGNPSGLRLRRGLALPMSERLGVTLRDDMDAIQLDAYRLDARPPAVKLPPSLMAAPSTGTALHLVPSAREMIVWSRTFLAVARRIRRCPSVVRVVGERCGTASSWPHTSPRLGRTSRRIDPGRRQPPNIAPFT